MEQEFFDFLKSGSINKTFDYKDKSKIIVNRVRYNDKLDILYSLNSYGGNVFDLNTPFKYSGIYDKENNKLYDVEYSIRYHILKWDYNSEKYISADKLYTLINKEMNDRISELSKEIKDTIVNINEIEIGDEIGDKDVLNKFIDGVTSETLEDYHKQFSTTKPQDLLDYLTDKETFIEEEARDFIIDNTTDILRSLALTEQKRKILKSIEYDKQHPYHKIKRIIDAIKEHNCVTVNLTINKDGIEQTFKYNADALKRGYNSSYLSTYNIEKLSDRNAFEENYGRMADIHYEDIIKITYGKNIIYEDDNFKIKEADSCLT